MAIKSRIMFKTGTQEEWDNSSFIPALGELCIIIDGVDTEQTNSKGDKIFQPKLKIGLGNKNITQLPFAITDSYITNQQIDSLFLQNNNNLLGTFILGTSTLG